MPTWGLKKNYEQNGNVPVFLPWNINQYNIIISLLSMPQLSIMNRHLAMVEIHGENKTSQPAALDPDATHTTGNYMRKLHSCETPGNNKLDLNTWNQHVGPWEYFKSHISHSNSGLNVTSVSGKWGTLLHAKTTGTGVKHISTRGSLEQGGAKKTAQDPF